LPCRVPINKRAQEVELASTSYDKLEMSSATCAPAYGTAGDAGHLLELDMDVEFSTPKWEALENAPGQFEHAARTVVSFADHEPMDVETRDVESTRQEHPNDANRIDEQARSTASRSIRADLSRHNHKQRRARPSTRLYSYRDPDDSRRRAYQDDRQHRKASPDAFENRVEATVVLAMADLDVKDEREGRRDGDRYRGGGYNKRRRDGMLATQNPECFCDINSGAQMTTTTTPATEAVEPSDAARMMDMRPVVDMKSLRGLGFASHWHTLLAPQSCHRTRPSRLRSCLERTTMTRG
jgi:hypothetical protein